MQLGAEVGQLVAHSVSVVPLSQPVESLPVAAVPPRLTLPPIADTPPVAEAPPFVVVPLPLAVLIAEVEPPEDVAPELAVARVVDEVPPFDDALDAADVPPFELLAPPAEFRLVLLEFASPPSASDEAPPDRADALLDVAAPP